MKKNNLGSILIGILIAIYVLLTQIQVWNLGERIDSLEKTLIWKGICDADDFLPAEYLTY